MRSNAVRQYLLAFLVILAILTSVSWGQTVTPSSYWKNEVAFPDDSFCSRGISRDSVRWIKFTILLEPYDPDTIYFQHSRKYLYHYTFGSELLDPFVGMTSQQFNSVTLYEHGQQAILGTIILPSYDNITSDTPIHEYGIQFVRQDAYTREEIRDLFNLVKSKVQAAPDVEAFYFPTYEQQDVAEANSDWFGAQGVPLGSTARWTDDNVCYSQGWALGALKFVTAENIDRAYRTGQLGPDDVLLTDGIPAELPYLAGILSLVPSTPNSHVALLAQTYDVPFAYLSLADDANLAQELVGRRILFSAYEDEYGSCNLRLIDTEQVLDEVTVAAILELKETETLNISPMAHCGTYGLPTEEIQPSEIIYAGGKASNFGLLRDVIPDNSPKAVALTFDVWNAFLDQPLLSVPQIALAPGEHIVFWADGGQGGDVTHAGFRLSRDGESIGLYDVDGATLIDAVRFGPQQEDVSHGRSSDGNDVWQSFTTATPGQANSDTAPIAGSGLVINEFMADNENTIEDPNQPGQHPDWIELYNGSDRTVTLNGMYLTDDVNDPTKWQIPVTTEAPTLREEVARHLAAYDSYPPADMGQLSIDLASIRSLFTSSGVTRFTEELRNGVLGVLMDSSCGFNLSAKLRFRSSTNVEDSEDFIGAGLYSSYSGCLADDLDDGNDVCHCDPNEDGQRSVFGAIRKVFASFYGDNAFLERLRHNVDETQVGMAMLVHHSFPDDIELANGVATVEVQGPESNTIVTLISQLGAVSVTNPEDDAIPEEVTVTILPAGSVVPAKLVTSSSLVPLGGTVMTWRDDYTELAEMLVAVSDAFGQNTGKTAYTLDLEYKKVTAGGEVLPAGGLVIKQVRQVPEPNQASTIAPVLLNTPIDFEVYSGEFELFGKTDVFADHRLKSFWTLETQTMILNTGNLNETLYDHASIEILDEDRLRSTTGQIADLPAADHTYDQGSSVLDTWRWSDLANPRTYELKTTSIPTAVAPSENPIITLADLGDYAFNLPYPCLTLTVQYERPVTSWHQQIWSSDPPSGLATATENTVYLWSPPAPRPDDVFQERSFTSENISIDTSFYYPPPVTGYADWAAHTAPLLRWNQTVIEGLTTEPIVLQGYYSQTYRPEHHNLVENFLFEPRLEPGISDALLGELADRNIRFIHMILVHQDDELAISDDIGSSIVTYGFD